MRPKTDIMGEGKERVNLNFESELITPALSYRLSGFCRSIGSLASEPMCSMSFDLNVFSPEESRGDIDLRSPRCRCILCHQRL